MSRSRPILHQRPRICEGGDVPNLDRPYRAIAVPFRAPDDVLVRPEALWARRLRRSGLLRGVWVLSGATDRRIADILAALIVRRLSDPLAARMSEPLLGWPPELIVMLHEIALLEGRELDIGVDTTVIADRVIARLSGLGVQFSLASRHAASNVDLGGAVVGRRTAHGHMRP
jgi:hypothetical protein